MFVLLKVKKFLYKIYSKLFKNLISFPCFLIMLIKKTWSVWRFRSAVCICDFLETRSYPAAFRLKTTYYTSNSCTFRAPLAACLSRKWAYFGPTLTITASYIKHFSKGSLTINLPCFALCCTIVKWVFIIVNKCDIKMQY